jgi:hypothetical protein
MYPVITVPDDAPDVFEQLGTKPKFWFGAAEAERYLFKFIERNGQPISGVDWSEKVASELCELLGLPHARYDFAVWRGINGVVCHNFVPVGGRLVAGNELLASVNKRYPKQQFYHVKEHSLRRVLAIVGLRRILPPIGWQAFSVVNSSLDVFIGYLMLDAWISNQDRHHENWGVIISPERTVHLAPTFDHNSSMGWNETDEKRRQRLTTKDKRASMEQYVRRARSAFFTFAPAEKPLLTLDAFIEAAKLRPLAAEAWLGRLPQISDREIKDVFDQVPRDRITRDGKAFALRILELNRNRLLALKVSR